MRVIAGSARGVRLKVPERATRPSTDRLREALFSMLQGRLEGARVLDLFSGSGALGIEALSRGAQQAVFVEVRRAAVAVVEENLEKVNMAEQGVVLQRDVSAFLSGSGEEFDLIFADPPYASNAGHDMAGALLDEAALGPRLAQGGLLVLEVEAERDVPEAPRWRLLERRKYGGSAILFYAHGDSR